jgi:hypothetical protein
MRMLHIRNMHQMHRRRSAHCMRTVPRGRVWWEAGSLAPIPVSSTTRSLPYFTTSHYFPLLATSTTSHAVVIGLRPACQLDRGSVPTPTFQNTKRSSVHVRISSSESDFSVVQVLEPCLAEFLRCKRIRDRSFEDPLDRREFPLAEASTTFVDGHTFPRSSDLSSYVHRPYSPPTPAQMQDCTVSSATCQRLM